MATNERFDETFLNTLEKWTSTKHTAGQQLSSDALLEVLGEVLGLASSSAAIWAPSAMPGGVLRGLGIEPKANMVITVKAGLGVVLDNTAGWLATGRGQVRPLYLQTDGSLTVPAADPTTPRIDRVLCKPNLYAADIEATQAKDPVTGQYGAPQHLKQRLRRKLRVGNWRSSRWGTGSR